MKNILKLSTMLLFVFILLFISACTIKKNKIEIQQINIQEEIIQEKAGTNSMEEMIVEGTIRNNEDEKKVTIKLHKFIIPSMNIAIYDINPKKPETIVGDVEFNIGNEIEIPYYEIETPLPDLAKSNLGFIKMLTKDVNIDIDQDVKSQNRDNILHTITIDTNLDIGNTNNITTKQTQDKTLVNINDINNIISYELVSSASKYLFYIYFNKATPDRYYLVGIPKGCSTVVCSNIISIEFLTK